MEISLDLQLVFINIMNNFIILGGYDVILIKLNGSDGLLIFGSRLGSSSNDYPLHIVILSTNLFIGGYT